MNVIFTKSGWEEYLFWQENDRKMLKRVNDLIKEISRTPYSGRGKPEKLKFDMTNMWSRRIDLKHRIVYQVIDEDILIYSCRFHYE
jgi:toxin YoeB